MTDESIANLYDSVEGTILARIRDLALGDATEANDAAKKIAAPQAEAQIWAATLVDIERARTIRSKSDDTTD